MSVAELSPKPQAIHDRLPATVGELSEEFEIRRSTVRDHLSNIDDIVGLEKVDRDGDTEYRPSRDGEPDKTRDDSLPPSKQSITKKANRHLLKLERRVAELLEDAEPLDVDVDTGGREDVVIHRTDAHIGSVVEDEFGNEVFNEDVAVERERTVTEKTVRLVERQEAAGYEFGTAHLLLGGDLVTGENIFNGQAHDISATVDEQIDLATELYLKEIERFQRPVASARLPGKCTLAGVCSKISTKALSTPFHLHKIIHTPTLPAPFKYTSKVLENRLSAVPWFLQYGGVGLGDILLGMCCWGIGVQ